MNIILSNQSIHLVKDKYYEIQKRNYRYTKADSKIPPTLAITVEILKEERLVTNRLLSVF